MSDAETVLGFPRRLKTDDSGSEEEKVLVEKTEVIEDESATSENNLASDCFGKEARTLSSLRFRKVRVRGVEQCWRWLISILVRMASVNKKGKKVIEGEDGIEEERDGEW